MATDTYPDTQQFPDTDGRGPKAQCPFMKPQHRHTAQGALSNGDWWPEQLNLRMLHQHAPAADPMGTDFDYRSAFMELDFQAVKRDIQALLTDSQDWWPADYGHYGPMFIRMAWHSAGTYRVQDGRGGGGHSMLRFAPLNSWPDNANLDKAVRLLWPIKQKYGANLSWGDLLILTGNVALEDMGLQTFGFGGGRVDLYEPEGDINWGPETDWLGDERYTGDRELQNPLGAVQMGLIYVNPEGPNGSGDPVASARDIRETFSRMAMNDEETVALIAGGHTFGKVHGAASPAENVEREPEGAPLEQMGLGWKNNFESGKGEHTISSGLEGAWTAKPTEWDNGYFENLFKYEWKQTKSPAGATQWIPTDESVANLVPDAHDPVKRHAPIMLTSDLALIKDEKYLPISKRFHDDPAYFAETFARAWYKLTHRDMGPKIRLLGPEVPEEELLWQDPVPAPDAPLIGEAEIATLKEKLLGCGLSLQQLVSTAWKAAATFRGTDLRGGADGARLRLAPQKDWDAHEPEELAKVLEVLEAVQTDFNAGLDGMKVSLADTIVLGGCAAVEAAARAAGSDVTVPFTPGRGDASQEQTDVESFAWLEPTADGFRNYMPFGGGRDGGDHGFPPQELLLDRAHALNLSAPEMTVLVGGMRAIGATHGGSKLGVLTNTPGQLNNAFFTTLLDNDLTWKKSERCAHFYEGSSRATGDAKWIATAVDLVFGSNSQLRAISEVYASKGGNDRFVDHFVKAWTKVMTLDRFDLHA
ncbi:catalase/peroxidase HPI [Phycisphaera mikurensis]|uniref:Catalase-peroxidase n=1 Tax=Phycisphaera mikurensis (strain NBRC 102666 / KCTC 22515 / FYK2301M01) TaxID=1142394 RepID=I0IG77_PHYMF|nr:catalase/peroxidase HPI [Phycisphaera mikurensis]MBB6440353.1 catalase-peroxidase [Phycisphaera mikurensis]BAM04265.1 peroxidase/catalase [Phycisphaera mikurensis NBRC 102666]